MARESARWAVNANRGEKKMSEKAWYDCSAMESTSTTTIGREERNWSESQKLSVYFQVNWHFLVDFFLLLLVPGVDYFVSTLLANKDFGPAKLFLQDHHREIMVITGEWKRKKNLSISQSNYSVDPIICYGYSFNRWQ